MAVILRSRLLTIPLCALGALPAAELAFGGDGLQCRVPGMGEFTISYPELSPGNRKPLDKKVAGRRVDLTYADNVTVGIDIGAGGKIDMRFKDMGKNDKFTLKMMIGPEYIDGGTWAVGKNEPKPFPADKPAKPHLFQGNAGAFAVADATGHRLAIGGLPEYAYMQVTDNREWGWKIFAWHATVPYNAGWESHSFTVSDGPATPGVAPVKIQPQVDRFGQTTRKDFPGKVKDEAELKADAAAEAAYYAAFKPMATDQWGGLPGSKEKLGLAATGFFHTEKKGERWILVDPDGNAFFHLGVCTFGFAPGEDATYVKERQAIYEWLPPTTGDYAAAWHPEKYWHDQAFSFFAANLIRKYGPDYLASKDRHLGVLVDRVRAFGFNSIGAFSGDSPAFAEKRIPRMAHCGIKPELPGIRGVSDPFDAESLRTTDEAWAKSVAAKADDPLIIGYFFANEQAFEDLPRGVPQLKGKHAAKRRLVEELQKKYATIADFNQAWKVQVADFAALADTALPVQTPAAFADMKAYTELFLDTYFRTMTELFRKHDKNHLMVGNRWQPGTANSEALCRAAGKYMDVISLNYYCVGVDKGFVGRLHQWTGDKPMMWSEFYYTSAAESNCAGGGGDMATQKGRGQAYRQYVEQAASLGYVVGIEWFTLVDQAVTGRWFEKMTGERNNTGLFNVADRPYQDLVAEMAVAHRNLYGVWLDGQKPYVLDDPRFTGGAGTTRKVVTAGRVARGSLTIDGSTAGWPGRPPEMVGGDRLVSGKDAAGFEAAYKLCWDEDRLYLLANVSDPSPLNNGKSGDRLWNGDGIELFIGSENLDQPGALLFSDHQLLLGAKPDPKAGDWHLVNAPEQPAVALVTAANVDGRGYTLQAAIPWNSLHVTPAEGKELLFDLAIDDAPQGGDRSRQLMWNGGQRNSADRSYWGRLQLVP